MAKVIYDKNGIRIEEFDCGKEGTCYELNLIGEDKLGYFDGEKRKMFREEEMKELVADLVGLRIGREKSEDKVKLIRRRESYKSFIALAERLKEIELTSNQIEELLDIYYENTDSAHTYGSQRNADFAYESLQQVKEDLREGDLK